MNEPKPMNQGGSGRAAPRPDVPRVDPATEDHWLTRPTTVRRLWWALGVVLALTVLAQFLVPVKGKFVLDGTFAFGAWFGFGACLLMVLAARALGWWLKRPEDYYGDAGPSGEEERGDA